MFDEDQSATGSPQNSIDTDASADTAHRSVLSSRAADRLKEVAPPQHFVETIDRAQRLLTTLVANARCERHLNAALLVEGVRLFNESQAHPEEFDLLLHELRIEVNDGDYVICRRVVAVLFASLTKGEGSLADGQISRSRKSRYSKALHRAIEMAKVIPLDGLEGKIIALGGYYQLAKLEIEARRHATRTTEAVKSVAQDQPGARSKSLPNRKPSNPLGHFKITEPLREPTLAVVFPDGTAYAVCVPAEILAQYIREVRREA